MQYIKKNNLQLEEDQIIDIILKSQSDVEFDIQRYQDKIPCGWEIKPRRNPLKVKKTFFINTAKHAVHEP